MGVTVVLTSLWGLTSSLGAFREWPGLCLWQLNLNFPFYITHRQSHHLQRWCHHPEAPRRRPSGCQDLGGHRQITRCRGRRAAWLRSEAQNAAVSLFPLAVVRTLWELSMEYRRFFWFISRGLIFCDNFQIFSTFSARSDGWFGNFKATKFTFCEHKWLGNGNSPSNGMQSEPSPS